MKWPSVKSLWDDTLAVFVRFPLQVLVTLLAMTTCFLLIEHKGSIVVEENLVKLLLICNLSLVLLLSADLFSEVNGLNLVKKWGLRLLCLLIALVLYFTLQPTIVSGDRYRFVLLAFAFHLLVAFAPFINKGNVNGFWEYNKALFLRILTAALYAHVLFLGLAVALMAINGLFNVKIESDVYLHLLTVVGICFTTIFFLAGVPSDFKRLNENVHPYPKGLKIFSQYVLIPLLTIYLAILLVYEVKIIISWEFPKGMVSALILGYAVFGVLSLLLIHPVKDEEGNGWMKLFARFFYFMMIPLVVLLLLAVWERLRNYGITEPRYILMVLAVWLTIITAYFLISKRDNIKIIPVSLCVLALLAAYGPQSAFSISAYSQRQRLHQLINSTDAYALKEKPAIVRYLVTEHGLTALQGFTRVDLNSVEEHIKDRAGKTNLSRHEVNNRLVDTAFSVLKVKKAEESNKRLVFFYAKTPLNVKGYDYLLELDNYMSSTTAEVNGATLEVTKTKGQLTVGVGGQTFLLNTDRLVAAVDKAYLSGALKPYGSGNGFYVPQEAMSVEGLGTKYELRLLVSELTITDAGKGDAGDYNFKGYLLIKIK